jgi:hypothetical protein
MDKFFISKNDLKSLLIKAFEEGYCGYEELKEGAVDSIIEEYDQNVMVKLALSSIGPNACCVDGTMLTCSMNGEAYTFTN